MADTRLVIRATGVVQGVGFRPFVHALAARHGLRGFVLNDTSGVSIEAEGPPEALESFLRGLRSDLPPAARLFSLEVTRREPAGYEGFRIRESLSEAARDLPVSPDLAACGACIREVFDPADRRHRYPFTNCTNCGPRFTIIRDVPYDRPRTTMAAFEMCPRCRAEYDDPSDRRFHAQPNACPACGPRLALLDFSGAPCGPDDPLRRAAAMLREGLIVAIKGLGGYHLACDAANEEVVARLRERKRRRGEPFALMVRDLEAARKLALVDDAESALLLDPARPIVLLRRREGARVASEVAPRQNYLGIMLPYTPLHHLLLGECGLDLVMTSGNVHDEPIAYKDDEALSRLRGMADAFLVHDREIHVRCDDSVMRIFRGREMPIRRSRGYAPLPVRLRREFARPVLAVGALLKNTFCLAKNNYAYLSQHIGDLENVPTMESFEQGIEHFRRFFDIRPESAAHDMHPDYLSTRYALSLPGLEKIGVQHHHAHVAACMADNDIEEPVIGAALDGAGYGADGRVWGGEFLVVGPDGMYERAAHLKYRPMPGGDAAVREPWRMALSHLLCAFGGDIPSLPFLREVDPRKLELTKEMVRKGINSPETSSMGRLFDAVAAMAGIRTSVAYEAQAAMELEMAADESVKGSYPFEIAGGEIDTDGIIRGAAGDLARGAAVPEVAGKFHNSAAALVAAACEAVRRRRGLNKVVLTGGVFQNMLLLGKASEALSTAGFEVFTHRRVPPNDGGISLGQAVVANWRLLCASPSR